MTRDTLPTPAAQRARLTAPDRREKILQAARRVFASSGLAGARVRDIAAQAGITDAMLYRHFSSKDELFEAAVAQPIESAVATLVESMSNLSIAYSPTGEPLRSYGRQFTVQLYEAMGELAPMLGVVLFGDAEQSRRYFVERIRPSLQKIEASIRENLHKWPHRDFDVPSAVEWFFGMVWFAATIDHLTGRPRNIERQVDEMWAMLMDGFMVKLPNEPTAFSPNADPTQQPGPDTDDDEFTVKRSGGAGVEMPVERDDR